MTEKNYYWGTGRRKTAVARVRLAAGVGDVIVNGKPLGEYFPRETLASLVTGPLKVTGAEGKYQISVKVEGGGVPGQAGAVSHGIASALAEADESLRPILRKGGFLTRDPRMKERKKPGLKRARKAPQYTKR
ncbi:MAG: 30S ribosomal protein S9 [Chloroflexota bacterium]|jgi:small subunit ribosomal protein S9